MTARYAKEPKNVEVLFKLARKCGDRYKGELTAKSKEIYKKVVELDPEGKAGAYADQELNVQIPYTQGAEFELGRMAAGFGGPESDPIPLRSFIKKYPTSPLLKNAYLYAAFYYQSEGPKEDAVKFFEEYTAKYPENRDALARYVGRIIRDKEPLDKGIALSEKLSALQGLPMNPAYQEDLAELLILKGDPAKAEDEYGKDFIDGYLSGVRFALGRYAEFWIGQNKNLESAEAMADLMAKTAPDSQWYGLQQAAGIYLKLGKTDKALAVFGPEFIKRQGDDEEVHVAYASFWSRQGEGRAGMNLESASEAARKAVGLKPDLFNNFTLATVLFKLKKYQEALPYAEKAAQLAKDEALNTTGFPIQMYTKLVKDINDALAKEKGEVKK